MTSPFLHQLRTSPTSDVPARDAVLVAVDTMLKGSSRSAELLTRAWDAAKDAALNPTVRTQRVSTLANAAYTARTNAEVAKYRALYMLVAEESGNRAASWSQVAAQTKNKLTKVAAMDQVDYYRDRRNLMVRAAEATEKALQNVPPLPQAQTSSDYDMYRPVGWRPNGFVSSPRVTPAGLRGLSQLPLGDTDWWASLRNAFGQGIKATGEAASVEGQKVAGSNPTGGIALNVSGQLLAKLSTMLGPSEQGKGDAAVVVEPSTFPWGLVVSSVAVVVGGVAAWKFFERR